MFLYQQQVSLFTIQELRVSWGSGKDKSCCWVFFFFALNSIMSNKWTCAPRPKLLVLVPTRFVGILLGESIDWALSQPIPEFLNETSHVFGFCTFQDKISSDRGQTHWLCSETVFAKKDSTHFMLLPSLFNCGFNVWVGVRGSVPLNVDVLDLNVGKLLECLISPLPQENDAIPVYSHKKPVPGQT